MARRVPSNWGHLQNEGASAGADRSGEDLAALPGRLGQALGCLAVVGIESGEASLGLAHCISNGHRCSLLGGRCDRLTRKRAGPPPYGRSRWCPGPRRACPPTDIVLVGVSTSALGAAPPTGPFDSSSGSVILGCRWRWAPGVRAGDRGWGDVVPCSVWDASGPSVRPGAPAATARRNWRRHSLRSLTLGPGATFPSTLRATVAPSASPWSSSFPASTHTKGEPP